MVEPLTLLPSTAETTSPGCRPALSAGDPEIGLTTTRTQLSESVAQADRLAGSLRFLTAISAPIPLNFPDSEPNACWKSRGDMYPLNGSWTPFWNMPWMAP